MTQYLILPTEQEALDRSHTGHVTDTVIKEVRLDPSVPVASRPMVIAQRRPAVAAKIEATYVTQYRWATSVGVDGQTALVIDGDEQLLTAEEQAGLVPTLPEDNWPPPEPPPVPATEPPVNRDVPHAYQEADRLVCTMGNWEDPPPDSYAFQWQVDDTDIAGAVASEYPVTAADDGVTFVCVVTATNAIGSTWIASNEVVAVAAI